MRKFWDKVPKAVRVELLLAVNAEKDSRAKPSDDVLFRIANLTRLNLGHLDLGDAEFLRDLPHLQYLHLDKGQLTSLAAVGTLTKLESLSIERTGITSLAPLAALTRLRSLSCSENALTSLEGLSSMHRLTNLHAASVGIDDLGPLSGLPELETLTVYQNPIADLSPLANCKRRREPSQHARCHPFCLLHPSVPSRGKARCRKPMRATGQVTCAMAPIGVCGRCDHRSAGGAGGLQKP